MRKIYNYENATIIVVNTNVCTSERIRKATEKFMKKVIKERGTYGNSDTTKHFRKE